MTNTVTSKTRVLWPVRSTDLFGSDHPSDEKRIVCRGDRIPQSLPTSPQHLDWIVCEHRIMADERCLFRIGLGDQQPVKGVPVMCWQALQG